MRTSFAYMNVGQSPVLDARSRELMTIAHELGDDEVRLWALNLGVWASAYLAEMTRFDQLFPQYTQLVEQLRQPLWDYAVVVLRFFRALLAGDLDLAERLVQQVDEAGRRNAWCPEGVYGLLMFFVWREKGRLAGLAAALRTVVRLNPGAALWKPGLAALYAELGMLAEARAEFERLATEDFAPVPGDATRELCLGLLAEVCAALGDGARAAHLLEHLRPCEGRLLACYGNGGCVGPTDRLLGMLASVVGRQADADRWFERALRLSRRIESPLWTAHCLHDYAVHLGPTDRERAHGMLAEAAKLCERHALVALGQRASARLALELAPIGD